MASFGLKLGLDLEMRGAQPHQKFQGVPPPRAIHSFNRLLGLCIFILLCHMSFQSQKLRKQPCLEAIKKNKNRLLDKWDHIVAMRDTLLQ